MKTTLALFLAITLGAAAQERPPILYPPGGVSKPAPAPPKTSLSLDVKGVAAKAVTKNDFMTDYGSYDKTTERERTIELTVRNFGREAAGATVTVEWLGRRVSDKQLVIVKRRAFPLGIGAGRAATWQESSGLVKGADMKLTMIGVRERSGSTIAGWRATLRGEDGGELAMKASEQAYVDAAKRGDAYPALGTAKTATEPLLEVPPGALPPPPAETAPISPAPTVFSPF